MENEADSGQSLSESFASYDLNTCSWRTSQLCVFGGWIEYSETWPRAGIMRSGRCYRQKPLVRRTYGKGSSSLGTPTASMSVRSAKFAKGKLPSPAEVARWPTPEAANQEGYQVANGKRYPRLGAMARMYPTPSARDWKGGRSSEATQQRNSRPLNEVVENQTASGQLNPMWVEWLMGFPIGHSDLEPLVMP